MDFISHLQKYLSSEAIAKLNASLLEKEKKALLLNTNKMNEDELLSLFPHLVKHPIVKNAYLYDKDEYDLGKSIYHELGCFYIQEPSAMLPAYLLPSIEDGLILDLCAAPGGKSIGVSLSNPKSVIISNDLSANRCQILLSNIERLGCSNIVVTNNDFSTIYDNFLERFDSIILDAPCSGSGMFRKDNHYMEEDWSYSKVVKCASIQKQLILMAYKMLKKGGTLCYSTCSFSYEEDEEVVSYLLQNSDAQLLPIPSSTLYYVDKSKIGIHLFPNLFPGEGQYIALIKKPGERSVTKKEISKYKFPYLSSLNNYSSYSFFNFSNYIFMLPFDISTKGLKIIRYGTKVGKIDKDLFFYDYHLSHVLKVFNNVIDLTMEETIQFINGEQLNKINPYKGYVLLTYQNIPIAFGKSDRQVIKNHYPKGLRKKINISR